VGHFTYSVGDNSFEVESDRRNAATPAEALKAVRLAFVTDLCSNIDDARPKEGSLIDSFSVFDIELVPQADEHDQFVTTQVCLCVLKMFKPSSCFSLCSLHHIFSSSLSIFSSLSISISLNLLSYFSFFISLSLSLPLFSLLLRLLSIFSLTSSISLSHLSLSISPLSLNVANDRGWRELPTLNLLTILWPRILELVQTKQTSSLAEMDFSYYTLFSERTCVFLFCPLVLCLGRSRMCVD